MTEAVALDTVCIEGLPDTLKYVPRGPMDASDPDGDIKRAEWQQWDRDMREYRVERRSQIRANAGLIPYEVARCAHDPAYFVAMYCWIIEPRAESGMFTAPWVPFPIQIDLIRWLDECMATKGVKRDGVISKSRDMGATWTMCAWLVHGWLFRSPWSWLLMSRNEDLVDSKSDDAIFTKMEFILSELPEWLLPEGFSLGSQKYNSDLILINPATRAQLKGESTNSKAGRSGRYTGLLVDEAAFVRNFTTIWGGLAATTDHRFAVSSESFDEGPYFHELGVGNTNPHHLRPSLFEMNWWDRPDRDLAWFENERDRAEANNELGKFHTEYLRDPRADGSMYVYPSAMTLVPDPEVAYDPTGIMYASIDPGFNDECAIVWLQHQAPHHCCLGYYQARGKEADFIGSIITGKPVIDVPDLDDHAHDWSELGSGYWECAECGQQGREKYDYSHRERRLMEWTRSLPNGYLSNGHFFGDVSGKARHGAIALSMYDILRIKHGIFVNIDQTIAGEDVGFRQKARLIQNRIEFLRQMIPLLRFSQDNDAPRALAHLQASKFKEETGRTTTEPREPKHDESSHCRTAFEYWAAHLMLARSLEGVGRNRAANRAKRNARDLTPDNPNFRPFGRKERFSVGRIR